MPDHFAASFYMKPGAPQKQFEFEVMFYWGQS